MNQETSSRSDSRARFFSCTKQCGYSCATFWYNNHTTSVRKARLCQVENSMEEKMKQPLLLHVFGTSEPCG